MRAVARRVAWGFILAVLALWSLYVIVANVVLRTRILRNLFDSFPRRTLEYESAWTVWPGVVHVRDLHLRVRDFADEWLLVVDHGLVNIDLGALLHRRFHVRWADVRGVSLRFRTRLDPRVPHAKTDALPPIEGFQPIPYQDLWEWTPPPDEAHDENFVIDVRGVQADVREIWIQDYRFVGAAHARGGFFLRPGRELEVGPAHLDVDHGEVLVGDDLAMQGRGNVDVRMPRFSLKEWTDGDVMNALAVVDARLEATIPSWAFLERRYLESPANLVDGESTLRVEAHVRDGELSKGTKIELDTRALSIETPKVTVRASANTIVEVNETNGEPTMIVRSNARPFEVRLAADPRRPVRAPLLALFATSKNLALRKPFNDLRLSLDAPDLQVTDLRLFQRLVPPSSKIVIGEGAAMGHAHVDALFASGAGDASLSLTSHTASVRANDAVVSGSIGVEAKIERFDLSTFDAELARTTIDVRDVVWKKGTQSEAPWWGVVVLDHASLRPKQKTVLSLAASIHMRDVRPMLAVYASIKGMPDWLRGVLAMEDFRAAARVRLGDGVDVDELRATSKDVSVRVKMHARHDHRRGAILVEWKGLAVGIDVRDDGSKPVLADARAWFEASR